MKRAALHRKAPLRKRNAERMEKRKAECFGEQAAACRAMPCAACWPSWYASPGMAAVDLVLQEATRPRQSEPHHVPSRGAGGTDKDCVPLCPECHREFHTIGERSFVAKYSVDLRAIAAWIHEELSR